MFGLSFLSPLFLIGAAAAAVPVLLHLFSRRADPVVPFAAMRYLRSAPVEQASRRRLREWLLLALRTAALVLLALAFARPYVVESVAVGSVATVVLVDTSASMTAPGQFERARDLARDAVQALPPGTPIAVVGFGATADVVAPLAADRASALQAIGSLQPGAGATRYRAALSRAAAVLDDRPGRLVVVTDLQASALAAADDGALPVNVDVQVLDVAAPGGNAAISSLRVAGGEAVAVVRSYATEAMVRQVTFAVEGRALGTLPVSVGAGGSEEVRLSLGGVAAEGALSASVDDPGGYRADNVRFAVLETAATPLVLLVTTSSDDREALYLERAISVADGTAGFRTQVLSGPEMSRRTSDTLAAGDAIVLLGTRGIDADGRRAIGEFVRTGGGLLIAASAAVDPAVTTEILAGLAQTSWRSQSAAALRFAPEDSRHPVFRSFAGTGVLSNVAFEHTSELVPSPAARVLARYSNGSPALVEEQAGDGRVLVFGSDLNREWNDFPVQPAFVPFVHESLRYLSATRARAAGYEVGELHGSSGAVPGVITVGEGTSNRRRVAVNVAPRESDPAGVTPEAFLATVSSRRTAASDSTPVTRGPTDDPSRLWQYALVLMLASLGAESIVGRRLG